jgi:hypothetical protein
MQLVSRSQIFAALSGLVWDSLVLELPPQFVSGRARYPGLEGQTVPVYNRKDMIGDVSEWFKARSLAEKDPGTLAHHSCYSKAGGQMTCVMLKCPWHKG